MSKNISNLSGRIGLKDNLFKKMSENVLNDSPKDIKEIAKEYNLGVSTIHGAESFYEFLRPSHREKKAFVCNGSACMCAGTQEKLKETLKSKLGNLGENKLLLITSITLMDEYFETKKKIEEKKDEIEKLKTKFKELKSLVYNYRDLKEKEISEFIKNQDNLKNEIEINRNNYETLVDKTTLELENFIKRNDPDFKIQ